MEVTSTVDLKLTSVEDLQILCEQHQRTRSAERNGNDSPCFELFVRAADDDDALAWEAFERQFKPMIVSWIRRKTRAILDYDEADDLWSETRERFWRYAHRPIADNYPHIGAVLNYWRQCAHTTAVDYNRRLESEKRGQLALSQELIAAQLSGSTFEDGVARDAFLACVRSLIQEHVEDEDLRLVMYLRFELELTPRDIAARHPDRFATPRVVYNKIDVVKKRLKRALEAYLTRCL